MAYQILLVEDDAELREIIVDYFSEKGEGVFQVDWAGTGGQAQEKLLEHSYDLVLFDVMLPEVDGYTLCRELRRYSDVPIVFLTARHQEEDKLYGYKLGGDDYITKPFSLAELYAKVLALIKRSKGMVREEIMMAGKIKLDPRRHQVFVNGAEVILAPKEFAILKILLENRGRVVSRENLLVRVWGYDFAGSDRVVDNHIKKLRQALGEAAAQIKTVIKIGYKLEEN